MSQQPSSILSYKIVRPIGAGSFSRVFLGKNEETGHCAALKVINKYQVQDKFQTYLQRECEILSALNHDNILPAYEILEDPNRVVIVTKYAADGDMLDYINSEGRLPEDEARGYLTQMIDAMQYAHSRGVVHRDLKLDNIFLDRNRVYIGDWGFATYFQKSRPDLRDTIGSLSYCAPEVLAQKTCYGPEIDIWSLGVILYGMVMGRLPFAGSDEDIVREKIIKGDYKLPETMSEPLKDLIQSMLCVNVKKRITLCKIMTHPWVVRQQSKQNSFKRVILSLLRHKSSNSGNELYH